MCHTFADISTAVCHTFADSTAVCHTFADISTAVCHTLADLDTAVFHYFADLGTAVHHTFTDLGTAVLCTFAGFSMTVPQLNKVWLAGILLLHCHSCSTLSQGISNFDAQLAASKSALQEETVLWDLNTFLWSVPFLVLFVSVD